MKMGKAFEGRERVPISASCTCVCVAGSRVTKINGSLPRR